MTQDARLLVSIGLGWIAWLLTKASLGGTALIVGVVVVACAFALTKPLVRDSEPMTAAPSVRRLAIGAGVALALGVALVFVVPAAGILAAGIGLVIAAVALGLHLASNRRARMGR